MGQNAEFQDSIHPTVRHPQSFKPMARYMAQSHLTAASRRVVERCRQLVDADQHADVWAGHLVLTLLMDESLASACLKRLGISRQWLQAGHVGDEVATSAAMLAIAEGDTIPFLTDDESTEFAMAVNSDLCGTKPHHAGFGNGGISSVREATDPDGFSSIIERAAFISRQTMAENGISSTHLLMGLVEVNEFIQQAFETAGVSVADIRGELGFESEQQTARLPVEITLSLPDSSSPHSSLQDPIRFTTTFNQQGRAGTASDTAGTAFMSPKPNSDQLTAVWRLLDANLNRTREGLRVLEDHARFVNNDSSASRSIKELRHAVVAAESCVSEYRSQLLANRDTVGDVGTAITVSGEASRLSLGDLVVANCRRVQESLRSLEEFGKLLSAEFAGRIKQIRYQMYQLELQLNTDCVPAGLQSLKSATRRQRLQAACLYVLITEQSCATNWKQVAEQALAGGADILQLREKHLNDRELLRRARWLTAACSQTGSLCIINDRVDIAVAADADGVHVGQDELDIGSVRKVLRSDQLLGLSTHSHIQFMTACREGADYVGVGPTFPSSTKMFDEFTGVALLQTVACSSAESTPWFAIGGITLGNLNQVIQAGCHRVAVTAAVTMGDSPTDACQSFRAKLQESNDPTVLNPQPFKSVNPDTVTLTKNGGE